MNNDLNHNPEWRMVTPLRLHFTRRDSQQRVDVRARIQSCHTFEWNAFCIMRHVRIPQARVGYGKRPKRRTSGTLLSRFVFRDFHEQRGTLFRKVAASLYEDKLILMPPERWRVYRVELEFPMIICHVREGQCFVRRGKPMALSERFCLDYSDEILDISALPDELGFRG